MFQIVLRLLVSVAMFCAVSRADPPSMERLQPAAGQRGTTFTLTVTGSGLQQVSEVLLYNPGVRCESLRATSDTALEISLSADAGLSPGPQALRLRSPGGLSELLTFQLTVLPVVVEQEDNNTVADAQSVPLNSTIVGVVSAADADCFRVWLGKGQRLSVEAEAMRAGGAMFDAVVNLYDDSASWLVSIDDTPLTRQDPWLSFTAPEEGDYIVEIHEASFEGDDDSRYALHIGDFPRPATVWPPGGQAGTRLAVEWEDAAEGRFRQELELPGRGGQTISVYPERSGEAGPVGVPFRVFSGANRVEGVDEPGSAAELPVAFNGRLSGADETDSWRFRGVSGERVRIEVWAARLGSAADTLLEVCSADGRLIAASDDEESHDSAVNAFLPADGIYEVRIREKRGRGGEDCFYRVEAAVFQPSITAFISRPDRRSQERQAVS
ncbi:MAG: PPC domain-containing protein, partial [Planctomycetota bacterium]